MTPLRIGLIGDRDDANVPAHRAIPLALKIAHRDMEITWLPTETIDRLDDEALGVFDGLWCVPACPYMSESGALTAIRFARENEVPFLGTCGGFQHALLEYARNVCGLTEVEHAEANPAAAVPLITPLTCSLVETEGRIRLAEGSRARRIYGCAEVVEPYHCRYGLSREFESHLEDGQLRFSGRDEAGEVRVLELADEAFFVATLFQPERAALRGEGHPLVSAYVEAILQRSRAS